MLQLLKLCLIQNFSFFLQNVSFNFINTLHKFTLLLWLWIYTQLTTDNFKSPHGRVSRKVSGAREQKWSPLATGLPLILVPAVYVGRSFAACIDLRVPAALSLVEWYDPAVMHVVDTIFIISDSNAWMFIYHDKWNSHGKIVNSCCLSLSFHGSPPCLLWTRLFAHWICDYSASANIIRSFGEVRGIYWLN